VGEVNGGVASFRDLLRLTSPAEHAGVELTEEFGSNDRCRTVLEELCWSEEPIFPRCQSKAIKIANRFQ
jgi:hypothetical protein